VEILTIINNNAQTVTAFGVIAALFNLHNTYHHRISPSVLRCWICHCFATTGFCKPHI